MLEPFQEQKDVIMIGPNKDIEVPLPRLTLKKIMAVTGAVDKLIKSAKDKSPQLFDLFTKNSDTSNLSVGVELVKLVPSLLPVIMEEMVDVIAIYLGKPKEWVEDNMDMEDLVATAQPFFVSIMKQANHVLGPLSKLFPKAEVLPEQSQTSSTSSLAPTDGV